MIYKAVVRYLLGGAPFVLGTMLWHHVYGDQSGEDYAVLWGLFSIHLIFWFAVATLFSLTLVMSKKAREHFLVWPSSIVERDEREQHISGLCARHTYLATIAISLLMLFVSTVNVSLQQLPPEQQVDGKTQSLSISLNMKLFETDTPESQTLLLGMPLQSQGVLILLLVWQLGIFRFYLRRENREYT